MGSFFFAAEQEGKMKMGWEERVVFLTFFFFLQNTFFFSFGVSSFAHFSLSPLFIRPAGGL